MAYRLDPNYNALDRIDKWDKETQEVIKKRIADEVGVNFNYHFLGDREREILEILADVLIPQEKNKNYIKISEAIDRELAKNVKGARYGDGPWPREFYKQGLKEFSENAKKMYGKPIEDFSQQKLEEFVADIFRREPSDFLYRFLRRVLADSVKIYYSHPASWNEIGFPGPAYPEGYAYLSCGEKDDWEPEYTKKPRCFWRGFNF